MKAAVLQLSAGFGPRGLLGGRNRRRQSRQWQRLPLTDRLDRQVDLADHQAGIGRKAPRQAAFGPRRMMMAQAAAGIGPAQLDHHHGGRPVECFAVNRPLLAG
jgi:hypothetical protein